MKKNGFAALLILCAVLCFAAGALAETAPLSLGERLPEQLRKTKLACLYRREFKGVLVNNKWVVQARVDSNNLNLHLYEANGAPYAFKQSLRLADDGESICLTMYINSVGGGQIIQMDELALDALLKKGITEIAVVDRECFEQARYDVPELKRIIAFLGLGEREQLCVGARSEPVTVVGEDGVRRQVAL